MFKIVVFDYSSSPGGSLSRMLELAEQLPEYKFIFFTYYPIKSLHKWNLPNSIQTYRIYSFFDYTKKAQLQAKANTILSNRWTIVSQKILALLDAINNTFEITQALFWIGFRKVNLIQANLGFHKFPFLLSKTLKIPFIIYFRTLDPWIASNTEAINSASKLIFVAQRLRFEYEKLLNIPNEKALVIHSPNHALTRIKSMACQDMNIIHDLNQKGTTIIVAARIAKQKGQMIAAQAMANLVKKGINVYLLLAGTINPDQESRQYYEELLNFIARNKLEGNIILLGHRPDALHLIQQVDIALHPALLFEPMSGAAIESMQLGIPTIAAAIGGQADLIRHKENGFLFPPGDAQALTEIIEDIAEKRIDTSSIIAQGIKDSLAFSDPYRIQNEMRALYDGLFSNSNTQNH